MEKKQIEKMESGSRVERKQNEEVAIEIGAKSDLRKQRESGEKVARKEKERGSG